MGAVHPATPVRLFLAAFSRDDAALDWASVRAQDAWGPISLASPRFEFRETDYYQASMGDNLQKCFWLFERSIDPGAIAQIKLTTNAWEDEFAVLGISDQVRPLNLDPGYFTPAKLVLATTKDFAHRIYLSQGIFAEITLAYRHGAWQAMPWTFPDYQRTDYREFFSACRKQLTGGVHR